MQTLTPDTLTCDTSRLSLWLDDPDYAYAHGLLEAGESPFVRLRRWLLDRLAEWFNWTLTDVQMNWVFVAVALLCIVLVVWFVWWKHPGLFRRVGANARPPADVEDTIYGIDFEAEIRRASKREDYYTAVRYTYLYVLKRLNDAGRICWQPYKTPTEYVYELADARSGDFRRLTNGFLRVRYGNYRPDRAFFEEMECLGETVCASAGEGGGS